MPTCALGALSMTTSGLITPASANAIWLSCEFSVSCATALAASEHRTALAIICLALVVVDESTLARSGIPPREAISVWIASDLYVSCTIARTCKTGAARCEERRVEAGAPV